MSISTPHNRGDLGDYAKTVLMPGDPLRAKFIAETFIEYSECVNDVRGINGYTGFYKGKRVSVMASGMGMPSMGIYSYELFKYYGVENIIRIGSAGAILPELKLRSIVLAQGACTNSNYAAQYGLAGSYAPIASYKLLKAAEAECERMNADYMIGNVLSSDTFYDASQTTAKWGTMGVMAVEMEAAALYMNAAYLGKNALCICTISDHLVTGEDCTAIERQESFTQMMEIALNIAPA